MAKARGLGLLHAASGSSNPKPAFACPTYSSLHCSTAGKLLYRAGSVPGEHPQRGGQHCEGAVFGRCTPCGRHLAPPGAHVLPDVEGPRTLSARKARTRCLSARAQVAAAGAARRPRTARPLVQEPIVAPDLAETATVRRLSRPSAPRKQQPCSRSATPCGRPRPAPSGPRPCRAGVQIETARLCDG